MDAGRWQQLEKIFNDALALPPDERASFLDCLCGDDASLRDEVDALLREAERPNEFLSGSGFELGVQALADEYSESLAGQTFATYTILRRIGRGGMGEVYLARDDRLGRKVAIKLLPKRLIEDKERVLRFKHEARTASAISHPNVAHVYEIGQSAGRLFTAMEFVSGLTLRQRFSRDSLKLGEAIDISNQVALAIVAAHAQGIIHRDIKPENIIIRPDGLVKVVDFGLAKLSEPARASLTSDARDTLITGQGRRVIHTEPGLLLGTATYMSPEQARGQETDERTDVWSWGVVFYEMLTGTPPFQGETNSDIIAEILKSEPDLTRTALRALPESMTDILRRALGKNRADRFAEMSEIVRALHALRRECFADGLLDLQIPLPEDIDPKAPTFHGEASEDENRPVQTRAAAVTSTSLAPAATVEPKTKVGVRKRSRSRKTLILVATVLIVAAIAIIALTRHPLMFRKPTPAATLEIEHLTTDGSVMDAAISPDGRLLAYVPIVQGKQSLHVKDLSSGESWELLPPDTTVLRGMRFALNNESVFYLAKQEGNTVNVLYRLPVRGGPSQKLVTNIDSPPALSPDRMRIAFIRSYPGQHRDALIIANVDGSAEREIVSRAHPDRLALSGVTWSPDGKLIAAGARRHDETEAAVLGVPVDGGVPVELTPWKWSVIRGVVWKNDGRTILLSAQLPGSNALQIWRVSYPEQTVTALTNDQNQYEGATLGPNVLVATHTYEIADLWSWQAANRPQRVTSDGHNGADGLTVTPNGRIAYTVGEYNASEVWSMNADGTNRLLLSKDGVHPSASKSGESIAYVSSVGNGHHIWIVDGNGEHARQLTFGEAEYYPGMSPDGQWVYYVSRAQNRGTLWKIPTTGGKPVQITFAGIIMNPVVAPDGKKVACTFRADEGDTWKIAILPADGGEPLKTFAVPSPFYQVIRWTADSQAFTYLETENGAQNVWQQPLNGSAPVKLTDFKEDSILHYDWCGPQQFILSRGGRRRDIVLMKNID